MRGLRILLVLDAAVLFWLGVAFIAAPGHIAALFGFRDLPTGVHYLIGMWGCVLATMALGYAVAASDPVRHVVWVQVGIARGTLECLFGLISVLRGVVTWQQAGFGTLVAALVALAYLALYPRVRPALASAAAAPATAAGEGG